MSPPQGRSRRSYAFLHTGLGEFTNLEPLYFSATTFTTLGYGDLTLDPGRVSSLARRADWLILIGWSTAVLVALTTRMTEVRRPRLKNRSVEAPQARNTP